MASGIFASKLAALAVLACPAAPHLRLAVPTLDAVRVLRWRGRPEQRPQEPVADKAWDSKRFRQWLRCRGIKSTIPPCERQRNRPKRGRPLKAGLVYAERWKVEGALAYCGNFRRLLVRHERYLALFRAFFRVASIVMALRQF